jgi:hypothetical protein
MHGNLSRRLIALLAVALATSASLCAQQPDTFRWMDFHSAKDQDVIVWVTRALAVENWTAIREIGVVYDAALVVTTNRATPQSQANADTFTVWSVSLTNHSITPLLKGVNLRWLEGMRFVAEGSEELAVLYDNCRECAANTYFTAFHYDPHQHIWVARWMRGGQGVPLWSANQPAGVAWTQVYAGLAEPNGRELLGTWNHFDYGRQKQPDDFVYRYELDPFSGLERTQLLGGMEADAMKLCLCNAQDAVPGLARGQDSPLCVPYIKREVVRTPVISPPANNHGKSVPPRSKPVH